MTEIKIAVYGASGFTGRLVAAELARRNIEAVFVGRDIERLRRAAMQAGVPDAELRAAGLDDVPALADAFAGSKAVINCVSPFVLFGEPVVRAAIAAGCHYVDTTGEQPYMQRIFDTCAEDAERAGVTVVPAMTDDGLPGDLIAHLVAERVEPVDELTIADMRVPSGASRGTARIALEHIDFLRTGGLGYEDGRWRTGLPARVTSIVVPGSSKESPVVRFALPGAITVPRHVRARRVVTVIDARTATGFTSVTPELVESMPEGPAEEVRRAGTWMMMAHAVDSAGRHAQGAVWGTDAYGTTAVIAVEGARRLAAEGARSGVLAPAQAYVPAGFLDWLAPHGVQWHVEPATEHAVST